MKRKLYRIRINHRVGKILLEERRKAQKTSLEAASCLNIPIGTMRSYELGTEGIPLRLFARLMRFYGADECESAWKMNSIPHELGNEGPLTSLARAAIHRLQAYSDIHVGPTAGPKASWQHWLF